MQLQPLHLFLYHGTTSTRAQRIERDGLKRTLETKPGSPLKRGALYLSDFGAPYFARERALLENDVPALVRVPISALDVEKLAPDEDFLILLHQAHDGPDGLSGIVRQLDAGGDGRSGALALNARSSRALGFDGQNNAASLWNARGLWPLAWKMSGNVAYFGDLAASTVRVAVLPDAARTFGTLPDGSPAWHCLDPVVAREVCDAAFDLRGPSRALSVPFPSLWPLAHDAFALGAHSIHGPAHWLDVERHARRIANQTRADETVCRLFAWFHDVMRQDENSDPQHGPRAAAWLESRRDFFGDLTAFQWDTLRAAVDGHTSGETSDEATIGACWDGDRLDLPRVGIEPKPELLSTGSARAFQTQRANEPQRMRPQSGLRDFTTRGTAPLTAEDIEAAQSLFADLGSI